MGIKQFVKKHSENYWTIGFVLNGFEGVMNDNPIQVKWLKMPPNACFADPFILDVNSDEIQVLVEEIPFGKQHKGVISLLKVDRHNFELKSKKIILELPTHLSFPCVLRENGKIYIYPESAKSGRLDIYEYNPITETTSFSKTICDDVVWDSCMTELFGEKLLFTAANNDYILDIYKWNESNKRFLPWKQVFSDDKNSRMGGQLFEYQGVIYYPAQDCNKRYGSAIQIKRVDYSNDNFSFEIIKRITSPHPKMKLGLHTLNGFKDIVVVDVVGYRYPILGRIIDWLFKVRKMIKI